MGSDMKDFFGTKRIKATAMSLGDYKAYQRWDLPEGQDAETPGYLVEYAYDEMTVPNHENHVGYISWSPAHVFEEAYHASGDMNFGHALEALKAGERVARAGWNGKCMWLRMIEPYDQKDQFAITELPDMDGTLTRHPYMKTADNKLVPWLCSLTDMMAEDWCIVGGAS